MKTPQEKTEEVMKEFEKLSQYVELQISPLWADWFNRYQEKVKSFILEKLQSRDSYWLKKIEEALEEIDKIKIDPLREKRGRPDINPFYIADQFSDLFQREGVRGHVLNLVKEELKKRLLK